MALGLKECGHMKNGKTKRCSRFEVDKNGGCATPVQPCLGAF
jgi:hypothetical protein